MTLRVGHASSVLAVPEGAALAGYVARSGAASGVLNPLEVGVVVLEGPRGVAALCVADLLHVDVPAAEACRTRVAAVLGTTPERVWLAATHTHAGPVPGDVTEALAEAAGEAARSALGVAAPARVTLHRGDLDGVGGQRTGATRRTSVPVDLLRVAEPSGGLVGVVGVVPVHPTVLGAGSTVVSADLPGGVRRGVAAAGAWCLVATGAAGDVSTRAHRREQTGAEVDRLGRLVSRALLTVAGTPAVAEAGDVVDGRVSEVVLAPADPEAPFRRDAVAAARRVLAGARASGDPVAVREATVALEGAELGGVESQPVRCVVSRLDLGGIRLLGLGGEPFLDLGVAAVAADPVSVLLGYTNGYAGYLPTTDAFAADDRDPARPSYEVLVARVAPGEPERALALLLGSSA